MKRLSLQRNKDKAGWAAYVEAWSPYLQRVGAKAETPATVGGRYKIPERSPCSLAGPFEAQDKLKPGRYIRMAR
jgi:hypothetical protein